jgi:hypothetical protein
VTADTVADIVGGLGPISGRCSVEQLDVGIFFPKKKKERIVCTRRNEVRRIVGDSRSDYLK